MRSCRPTEPDLTFKTHRRLQVGGERIDLAWHGSNHTPDNIYIHFPDHDTLMLVDILLPGWVPFDSFNVNEDVAGSLAAPATAVAYPWTHFIGGHMGRLGTRDDMVLYQQYVNDIIDGVKAALPAVDPTPFFVKYGNNLWAATQQYLDAVVALASGPVIQKYLGVLAAVDVYTPSTAFHILESIRLDDGFGSFVGLLPGCYPPNCDCGDQPADPLVYRWCSGGLRRAVCISTAAPCGPNWPARSFRRDVPGSRRELGRHPGRHGLLTGARAAARADVRRHEGGYRVGATPTG